jgi:hypothetical protein
MLRPIPAPGLRSAARAAAALLALSGATSCQCPSGAPSRTGRFDSNEIPDRAKRLEVVQRYLKLVTPIEDAAFSIDYHDNSQGCVPGPSDWSIKVALRVAPDRIPAWAAYYQREFPENAGAGSASDRDLSWGLRLARDGGLGDLRGAPKVFAVPQGIRAVYEQEGVVLVEDEAR